MMACEYDAWTSEVEVRLRAALPSLAGHRRLVAVQQRDLAAALCRIGELNGAIEVWQRETQSAQARAEQAEAQLAREPRELTPSEIREEKSIRKGEEEMQEGKKDADD